MNKLPLIYIEFSDADGEFFTSRWARFETLADLKSDLKSYFERFPLHSATFRFAIEGEGK
jgi:hypothetical protein